jgi:hypothetical protein
MCHLFLESMWQQGKDLVRKVYNFDHTFFKYASISDIEFKVSNPLRGVHKLRLQDLSFLTTCPLPLVNVICERPLTKSNLNLIFLLLWFIIIFNISQHQRIYQTGGLLIEI